jgi:GNAT superfamily N-acetyltransferase
VEKLSNYALYAKERMNEDTLEDDRGFTTYEIINDCLWIKDMFVRKEYRGQKVAREFFNTLFELAKERNCKELKSHVDVKTNGWNLSYDMLVREGFIPYVFDEQMIYLVKEI